MKQWLGILFPLPFLVILFLGWMNPFSQPDPMAAPDYVSALQRENGSLNPVSAIYLDYRFYDTLFEICVFFTASFGVSLVLSRFSTEQANDQEENPEEFSPVAPLFFFGATQVFSLFLVLTGHLSPGGGFVAGVVGGTGVLILSGNKPFHVLETELHRLKLHWIEQCVMLAIPILGIVSFFSKGVVLGNLFPTGNPGDLFSGGNALLLNALIGFKVFTGTWTIFFHFVRHRGMI
ncbi:MAG TPA: MnhB domain-containing protein [Thermotogota bacterium]|nr:MnhB domain-containing protein [Thermotogota bacterium]HRW91652.1 MnhB domain-containing protein [Thermotogota bacterium]